jgi:hypothetical protein
MEIDLKKRTSYRLVYFQPNPEDGERVCVGLLFRDQKEFSLVYDSAFRRLSCIAPRHEKGLLKTYIDELEETLRQARPEDEKMILRKFGPQIIVSEERALLAPLTSSIKQRLLERFVLGPHASIPVYVREEAPASYQKATDASIIAFINEYLPGESATMTLLAKPKQIIGRPLPNVAPVAASVRIPGRIVLIDGVDLKVASARQVLNRVNKVTHTFWEYGKAEKDHLLTGNDVLQRVALVLNGIPRYSTAQKDAHDFALHQFEREADLLVTDRTQEAGRLRKLLISG